MANDNLAFLINDGVNFKILQTPFSVTDKFQYVVCSRESGILKCYIDGVFVTSLDAN